MSTADEPLSAGFTAVNGKDLLPINTSSTNGTRRGSDERANGQPRISPPGQEKLTITTTTTQREDWITPANVDRHSYQQASYVDSEASHKRKRSGSIEHNSSSANSYHSHAIPSSTKQTPTTATTESDTPREDNLRLETHSAHQDPHSSDAQYNRQYMPSPEDNRHGASGQDPWHSTRYQPPYITSDEQLGEALQRASQNMDPRHHEYASPGDDDRSPYTPYDRREMSAGSDPKKRKRNFSNRTKTGCMTCRRRKKKCDENRPECKSRKGMEMHVIEPVLTF